MKVISALVLAASINAIGIEAASATVVFSDDFDNYAGTLNANSTSFNNNWIVLSGSVDLIGTGISGTSHDFLPGNGMYVDLDGSSFNGGHISTNATFGPGTYLIKFDLAGSQRNDTTNEVTVSFGGHSWIYNVASNAGFSPKTITFTTLTATALAFQNSPVNSDNMGALLDNVSVTAVPEPGSYAMMFAGLMMIGSMVVRKSKHSA